LHEEVGAGAREPKSRNGAIKGNVSVGKPTCHQGLRHIRLHIAGLREDGLPVPDATSIADYVEA
jgi:hypothetical protein